MVDVDAPIEHPAQVVEYVRLFNARRYFEAHEVLEDLWVMEPGPVRDCYKGLIMVAVALLHWQRGNASGAFRLWRDGTRYLAAYPAVVEGLPVGALRGHLDALFAPLAAGRAAAPAPPPEHHPVIALAPPR